MTQPEAAILDEGGRILFAEKDGIIVGTVALKYIESGVYELTKMAVDPAFQGLGAGKQLCMAAIDQAREMGACKVVLYSQTGLKAAIGIYRRLGFEEIPLEPGLYQRADIKMQLSL